MKNLSLLKLSWGKDGRSSRAHGAANARASIDGHQQRIEFLEFCGLLAAGRYKL
jgi:hypothetical protein